MLGCDTMNDLSQQVATAIVAGVFVVIGAIISSVLNLIAVWINNHYQSKITERKREAQEASYVRSARAKAYAQICESGMKLDHAIANKDTPSMLTYSQALKNDIERGSVVLYADPLVRLELKQLYIALIKSEQSTMLKSEVQSSINKTIRKMRVAMGAEPSVLPPEFLYDS